jgi:hypothetical protein
MIERGRDNIACLFRGNKLCQVGTWYVFAAMKVRPQSQVRDYSESICLD